MDEPAPYQAVSPRELTDFEQATRLWIKHFKPHSKEYEVPNRLAETQEIIEALGSCLAYPELTVKFSNVPEQHAQVTCMTLWTGDLNNPYPADTRMRPPTRSNLGKEERLHHWTLE